MKRILQGNRAQMSFAIKLKCQCGHEFRGSIDKAPLYCSQCGKRLVYESGSTILTEPRKDSVKTRFIDMVKVKFYYFLQELPNSEDLDYVDILKISNEIVHAKKEEINNYLRSHEMSIFNMDRHVNAIIQSILIPYAVRIESGIDALRQRKGANAKM